MIMNIEERFNFAMLGIIQIKLVELPYTGNRIVIQVLFDVTC